MLFLIQTSHIKEVISSFYERKLNHRERVISPDHTSFKSKVRMEIKFVAQSTQSSH